MRVLGAVADALLPAGGAFALGARDVATAERISAYLERVPPGTRSQVRWLLRAFDAIPIASRHRARFSALSDEARAAWLRSCDASRLPWQRVPLVLLKTLCLAAFCADRRVELALG